MTVATKMLTIGTGRLAGIRCYALETSGSDTDIDIDADMETLCERLESELSKFDPEPGMGVVIVGSNLIAASILFAKLLDYELQFIASCYEPSDPNKAVVMKSRSRKIEEDRWFKFERL